MIDKERHKKYIEDLKKLNDKAGTSNIETAKRIFSKFAKMSKGNPLIFLALMKKHGDLVVPSMVKEMKQSYKESSKIGLDYGKDKMK